MDKPLVSAVVTTHNRLQLLPRALDSVVVQSYDNIELIVVDDGSRQSALPIVEPYYDAISLHYIRNEAPMGACKARNQGIEEASGIFIAGLDDDDAWTEDRIGKLMDAYSDDYAFVTSDVRMMYKEGVPVWQKPKVITLEDLLYTNYVGNQGLIKKERIQAVGGFDESLNAAQDYDLWIRLAEEYGSIRNVQEPLQEVYLQHGGERISNPRDQLRGYLKFYQKHKDKMNKKQRKYQLYNIRKATGKVTGFTDLMGWVPPHRYWKEAKSWLAEKLFTT